MAFLRMKLCGKDVFLPDGGRDGNAVIGMGDVPIPLALDLKTVDEVEIHVFFDPVT